MSRHFTTQTNSGRWQPVFRLLCVTAVSFATPQLAAADKGESGGDHSGGSHSGRDGSDDSHHSESGRDNKGSGSKPDETRSRDTDISHDYKGGWRDRIRNGNYEVFDPAGRLVIRRRAKSDDYRKF